MPLCSASIGIAPDRAAWRLERDLRQLRGAPDQRVDRDRNPRRDRDAEILAVARDRDEDGRGAEADDDRAACRIARAHRLRRRARSAPTSDGFSVATSMRLCVCGFKKCGVATEEALAALRAAPDRAAERRSQSRPPRIAPASRPLRCEELREEDAVLVGRAPQLGRHAPGLCMRVPHAGREEQPSFVSVLPTSIVRSMLTSAYEHASLIAARATRRQRRLRRACRGRGARRRPTAARARCRRYRTRARRATSLTAIASRCLRAQLLARARLVLFGLGGEADQKAPPLRSPSAAKNVGVAARARRSAPRRCFFALLRERCPPAANRRPPPPRSRGRAPAARAAPRRRSLARS